MESLKRIIKPISWFLIGFIILTSVITITRLSSHGDVGIDLDSLDPITKEAVLTRYGDNLNRTILLSKEDILSSVIQYYKNLLKGDFGSTRKVERYIDSMGNFKSRIIEVDPVTEIMKDGFNKSIKLLLGSIFIALPFGILKGIIDSNKGKEKNSTFKLFTTIVGLSIPVIFLAPLFQYILFILRGKYGIIFPRTGDETFKHIILPTIVLSILPTMYIARITAMSMDKAYKDEYVQTSISKGSSKLRVLWVHVFRNVIVEIAASLPEVLTLIISDLAIVEYLFEYKGLTYQMIRYFNEGQSDAVTGLALVLLTVFTIFYLIFKILNLILEPKERRAAV